MPAIIDVIEYMFYDGYINVHFSNLSSGENKMVKYTLRLCCKCEVGANSNYVHLHIEKDFELPDRPREGEFILISEAEGAYFMPVYRVNHYLLDGKITVLCNAQPIHLLYFIEASSDWKYIAGSKMDWESLQACAKGKTSLGQLGWV